MRRADRIALHAALRDRERLRAWLRNIVVSCRGKATGLASQALHSGRWPDWPEYRNRNRKD